MGEDNPTTCQFFHQGATPPSDEQKTTSSPLPWGGNVFGLADLSYLASLNRPRVVGVIGPHNAGKTTLLAALYLLIFHGYGSERLRLIRSLTLGGWEAIASNLRFGGKNIPTFPAHTTMREARTPGLLHLGFRDASDTSHDLVITDAPGEWFRRWSVEEAASDAQGARWIAEKADAFLLVVDSAALTGPDSGQTLNSYNQILERFRKYRDERPLRVVWTKSDITIPNEIAKRLADRIDLLFPGAPLSHVSVKNLGEDPALQAAYLTLFVWMIDTDFPASQLGNRPRTTNDPFLFYR
jgi:Double-GTPase 2